MSFFRQICNSSTHQLINFATFLFKIHSCPNGLENIKFNHSISNIVAESTFLDADLTGLMIALQAYALESKLD